MSAEQLSPADLDRIMYGRSFRTLAGEHIPADSVRLVRPSRGWRRHVRRAKARRA
jgi:hypothetical protein